MPNKFYITTTLPYVNSDPHVGFAMEIIRADVVARFRRLLGDEVFFNTGTDEHGVKIYQKAVEQGKDAQAYVDEYAAKFRDLIKLLDISEVNFIRTTDEHHVRAAEEFWRICDKNGYIYKKQYQIKYCVGCELEKTDSELNDNGRCPIHPNKDLELIDEENYFFKFSAFQEKLLKLYQDNPDFVLPAKRFNEIKAFMERGLEDFSISRLATKMPWGIPVPGDESQVMYVWFDALVSYIAAIGWPENLERFGEWWPVTQYCGKDNLRQQSAMWQAMLMAANLPASKQIIINGFFNGAGGVKMSKSLGNVVHPNDVVSEYGVDALRYFVCREASAFEDSEFSMERFKETYNANLANGLGNLTSRIMKMASSNLEAVPVLPAPEWPTEIKQAFAEFNLQKYSDYVWMRINDLDKQIQETEPFKLVKVNPEEGKALIAGLVQELYQIAFWLQPLLPQTAAAIAQLVEANKAPEAPLFLRKD